MVVHANVVSQILSAALDERPLIQVWSWRKELFWAFSWSFVGSSVTWKLLQVKLWGKKLLLIAPVIVIATATGTVIASSYIAFLYGWWIPTVSPTLAFVVSAIVSTIFYKQWELEGANEKLQEYSLTLEQKGCQRRIYC